MGVFESTQAQNQAVETIPGAYESLAGVEKVYNPGKAALLSTILPGAGQFYNRSYWKIPIVWGGLVTFGALAYYNQQQNLLYTEELNWRNENPGQTNDPELERFSDASVERSRDQSIRFRDLNIILGVMWYGLNIMDAYVDAHLKGFEVNDNLSLGVSPELYSNGITYQPGISLGLKFRL
jgi:Family of unknown function (DUF5683)